jgi:ferrochelatase
VARTAVVVLNLGGPDGPDAVLPFLRNLFRDPAILRVPAIFRPFLAEVIARRRAPVARGIYAQLGGSSPIVGRTQAQASALEHALADVAPVRVFVAMRYWTPRAAAAAAEVRAFDPDRVVLLPLYPQYSTTTTESSLAEWARIFPAPSVVIGCYAAETWFAETCAERIRPMWTEAAVAGNARLLLSAHGLPTRVAKTDPYPAQVERTAAAVTAALDLDEESWRVCYQSRVGRMEWIGPSTEDEIRRAGSDGVPVVVAPISFVSEHSETLVELDIELRDFATAAGVPAYFRAPTVGDGETFIGGLAGLVRRALEGDLAPCPRRAGVQCPSRLCVTA